MMLNSTRIRGMAVMSSRNYRMMSSTTTSTSSSFVNGTTTVVASIGTVFAVTAGGAVALCQQEPTTTTTTTKLPMVSKDEMFTPPRRQSGPNWLKAQRFATATALRREQEECIETASIHYSKTLLFEAAQQNRMHQTIESEEREFRSQTTRSLPTIQATSSRIDQSSDSVSSSSSVPCLSINSGSRYNSTEAQRLPTYRSRRSS